MHVRIALAPFINETEKICCWLLMINLWLHADPFAEAPRTAIWRAPSGRTSNCGRVFGPRY